MAEIFFDMDGVLAVYEPADYVPPTTWDKLGSHYFANRPTDPFAIEATRAARDLLGHEIWVMSTLVTTPDVWFEQMRDKIAWAVREMGVPRDRVVVSAAPKAHVMRDILGRPLALDDILIDDYNPNLERWSEKGGTAVKYLNGINSRESWAGLSFGPGDGSVSDFLDEIRPYVTGRRS